MRIPVDIPDEDFALLEKLSAARGLRTEELIRLILREYLDAEECLRNPD